MFKYLRWDVKDKSFKTKQIITQEFSELGLKAGVLVYVSNN